MNFRGRKVKYSRWRWLLQGTTHELFLSLLELCIWQCSLLPQGGEALKLPGESWPSTDWGSKRHPHSHILSRLLCLWDHPGNLVHFIVPTGDVQRVLTDVIRWASNTGQHHVRLRNRNTSWSFPIWRHTNNVFQRVRLDVSSTIITAHLNFPLFDQLLPRKNHQLGAQSWFKRAVHAASAWQEEHTRAHIYKTHETHASFVHLRLYIFWYFPPGDDIVRVTYSNSPQCVLSFGW